ncbi:hypothetical protein UAS_01319 [Enterococcus asini ATCC 700915]|uniref:Uncharacterized protein n=1 Tax=Enterococcus asini ATCC 700915 TaxID=1158606 RepID=R2PQQ2_9ENTE|nr:lysylphosphatidylglycerol synthase domain-containing protein [Enterococcus asini]EOH86857.1 hypothetical protein UAS_01319 [Enterococcus asini ATCC 700915]EOT58220.1 hypothetical protein I579_01783 [Enterococcus asini ATCC 700915]
MKNNLNKSLKIIGNIITIVAIFYVIKRLMNNDYDYSQLLVSKNIFPMLIIIVVQSVMVMTNAFPWKILVEMLTERKVPFVETIPVYVSANLMKYVPGNVFQYVGRNQLAVRNRLPHLPVALATMLDVLITVIAAAIISIFFLYDFIAKYLRVNSWMQTALIIVGIIIVLAVFLMFLFRNQIWKKIENYSYLFSTKSIKTILVALIYYIIVLMISSLMYLIVVIYITDTPLSSQVFLQLFSAYTLAWLVGFITPGAPGGIGIKELVMVAVTGGYIGTDVITLSMVIIRILLVVADCIAFVFGKIFEIIYKTKGRQNASN